MEAGSGVARRHDTDVVMRATLHAYKPPLLAKGRMIRPPDLQGGESMACVLPKRHSVADDSHN
eukprot:1823439-Pleurochrysis_carterae.AAC.1